MDRRTFLVNALAAAMVPRIRHDGPALRIGLLATGPDLRARRNGAVLGVEEAQHAAKLFGGRAELLLLANADEATTAAAVLGDESLDTSRVLAHNAARGDHLFFNVACASDELRGAECSPFMFHVAPSEAMLRDARMRAPNASAVTAWDGALVRFGADTLNDRFRQRFGTSMTPSAWACWFAVKVLWESSLRLKTADPRTLAEYLTRDATQFDGHKGHPLSFRAWDHQLRQFLYARIGAKLVDVPDAATPETPWRDVLDMLGTTRSASACRLSP